VVIGAAWVLHAIGAVRNGYCRDKK